MDKRIIAINLPQFHPFKENNEWWGEGFTEWRNVVNARPRYWGHYQPRCPRDLGFYDLRLPAARDAPASLAKQYGIHGFCYYHYWFNGKVLMEEPMKAVLESKKPDFPFMICWANENWTRAWDGRTRNVLIEQQYSEDDDLAHIKYLMPDLLDSRYIRIDNKPVLAIYRSPLLPDVNKTIEIWQNEARRNDIELYIVRFESANQCGIQYMKDFDASVEFQPISKNGYKYSLCQRCINSITRRLGLDSYFATHINYKKYVKYQLKHQFKQDYKRFPCVTPMWDNSPRRKKAYFSFKNTKPEYYKYWLAGVLKKFIPYSKEENLVFINAWNEWAEGNYLEPDMKYGRAYLEATLEAINLVETDK
jgi:lipopolysaccharide biosynthesis protein